MQIRKIHYINYSVGRRFYLITAFNNIFLCPKYNGGDEWGGTFTMNPQKVYLSNEEYAEMIEQIKSAL